MIRRNLAFGLVLTLAFACQKKGGSSDEASNPEQATADQGTEDEANPDDAAPVDEQGTAPDFLVGKWASECINQPTYVAASIILQYEFTADGNASSKTISYAGADCTKRFTKPDVDNLVAQVNAERAGQAMPLPPLNEAELVPYTALWFPPINPFSFKLGKTLKDKSVEMNVTQKVSGDTLNTYLTIYVQENDLYFAQLCLKSDLDAGACNQIVGDSVKNRAKDMRNSIPFHKI